jgi:hypothetical protein
MLASVLPSVDPTTAGVIFQVPAASEIQTYREICPGQWEYTQASASPLVDVYPDAVPDSASVSEKIRLATTDPISTVSASGQNNPPATERRPQRYARNERQLEGVALFGSFAGANQQDRKRFVSIPWMVSNEQASAIAQHLGAELIGRRQGAQILLALTDVWLTNENPYPVIHVREPRLVFEGGEMTVVHDTIVYQVDALSFEHDRTRATVGCELIWLATIPAGATVPVLPYVPTVMRSGVAPVLSLSSITGSFGSLIIRSGVAPLINLFASSGTGATTIIRSGVAPVLELSALNGEYSLPVIRSGVAPVLRLSALSGSRNASVERSGVGAVLMLHAGFGSFANQVGGDTAYVASQMPNVPITQRQAVADAALAAASAIGGGTTQYQVIDTIVARTYNWLVFRPGATFQDNAGTIAAAAGDPVARVNPWIGSIHAYSLTNDRRPILTASNGASFDGLNDYLISSTASFALPATFSVARKTNAFFAANDYPGVFVMRTGSIVKPGIAASNENILLTGVGLQGVGNTPTATNNVTWDSATVGAINGASVNASNFGAFNIGVELPYPTGFNIVYGGKPSSVGSKTAAIGADSFDTSGFNRYWLGEIGDLMWLNALLSTNERAIFTAFLKALWSVV